MNIDEYVSRSESLAKGLVRLARAHTDALPGDVASEVRMQGMFIALVMLTIEHTDGSEKAVAMMSRAPWKILVPIAERLLSEAP